MGTRGATPRREGTWPVLVEQVALLRVYCGVELSDIWDGYLGLLPARHRGHAEGQSGCCESRPAATIRRSHLARQAYLAEAGGENVLVWGDQRSQKARAKVNVFAELERISDCGKDELRLASDMQQGCRLWARPSCATKGGDNDPAWFETSEWKRAETIFTVASRGNPVCHLYQRRFPDLWPWLVADYASGPELESFKAELRKHCDIDEEYHGSCTMVMGWPRAAFLGRMCLRGLVSIIVQYVDSCGRDVLNMVEVPVEESEEPLCTHRTTFQLDLLYSASCGLCRVVEVNFTSAGPVFQPCRSSRGPLCN